MKQFIERVKHHIKEMYGGNTYNPEVGKIVADFHLDRIIKNLKEVETNSQTKIHLGGSSLIDYKNRWVPPTLIENPPLDSCVMKEENFAPLLPVVSFVNFDEVINKHILTKGKPLAIYYFGSGSSANYKSILENTSSGNVTLNDILF